MGSNPWLYILGSAVIVVASALLLGYLFSALMVVIGGKASEKVQEKHRREMEEMLPGKNCGQCGFESCALYADAVLHNLADEDLCPHGTEELPQKLEDCRKHLQASLEDPTPPEKKEKKSIFNKKYGPKE